MTPWYLYFILKQVLYQTQLCNPFKITYIYIVIHWEKFFKGQMEREYLSFREFFRWLCNFIYLVRVLQHDDIMSLQVVLENMYKTY